MLGRNGSYQLDWVQSEEIHSLHRHDPQLSTLTDRISYTSNRIKRVLLTISPFNSAVTAQLTLDFFDFTQFRSTTSSFISSIVPSNQHSWIMVVEERGWRKNDLNRRETRRAGEGNAKGLSQITMSTLLAWVSPPFHYLHSHTLFNYSHTPPISLIDCLTSFHHHLLRLWPIFAESLITPPAPFPHRIIFPGSSQEEYTIGARTSQNGLELVENHRKRECLRMTEKGWRSSLS